MECRRTWLDRGIERHLRAGRGHRLGFQYPAGIAGETEARIEIEGPGDNHRAQKKGRTEGEEQGSTVLLPGGGAFHRSSRARRNATTACHGTELLARSIV